MGSAILGAVGFIVLLGQPALAQVTCSPNPYVSGSLSCSNAGTVNVTAATSSGITTVTTGTGSATSTNTGNIVTSGANDTGITTQTSNGNATSINSGNITATGASSTGILTNAIAGPGDATANNSGNVTLTQGGFGIRTLTDSGTATTTNSGNVSVSGAGSSCYLQTGLGACGVFLGNNIGIYTATGTVPADTPLGTAAVTSADATTNNAGNVVVVGTTLAVTESGLGFPSFSGTTGISTVVNNVGNATTTNTGVVSVTGPNATGISTRTYTGNATTTNTGIVNVVGTGVNLGNGSLGQNGSSASVGSLQISGVNASGIVTSAIVGNATVFNSGIVTVSNGGTGITIGSSANSLLVNSGVISAPDGVAVQFIVSAADPATLTLQQGSFIVGAINMIGAGDSVNVNAVNQNLTFNTLTGVNIAGTAPYVVNGNRIVSVDPTGFGVTDRGLMDFTRAVSATLGGRVSDTSNGVAGRGGALGFAAFDDSVSRFDDAFGQAMGYAKAPSDAVLFKNPTATAPDGTTVWAKGFYGRHIQPADAPALRSVTNFYGGAIGADKLMRPDLRLGGFIGGGAIDSTIDFNAGKAKSDVVFAGVYGRKELGAAFVDFALLGGHTGNNTTRNINNNLVANGLESATASFGGWFFSPEVAAGYRYDLAPGWSLTPAARLRYLVASYDGFTESGSTANMTAAGRTLQNAEERGDVTLTRTLLSDTGRLQVGLTAGVLGQQRTGSGTVNAILLGQALAFATPGKSSIAGAYAATSLDWRMKSGIALFAGAEYTAMSDSSSTVTGRAGVRVGF